MTKLDGCVRCFSHLAKAWYGQTPVNDYGCVDELTVGFYAPDGGTTGEFTIRWMRLADNVVPRLEVFDDGWLALNACRDLLAKLAELDDTAPTPAEVCALLLECGFQDTTPRQRGGEVRGAVKAQATEPPAVVLSGGAGEVPTPFDVTDSTHHYGPCPNCGATHGMGLVTRASQLAVECDRCGHRGPEIEVPALAQWESWPVSAAERDRRAVEGWNDQSKNPAAYGLRRR